MLKWFGKFRYKLIRTIPIDAIGAGFLNKGEHSVEFIYLFENGFGWRKARATHWSFEDHPAVVKWKHRG